MIIQAVIDRMGRLNLVIEIKCKCSGHNRQLKCKVVKGVVEAECKSCGKKVFLKNVKVKFDK